MVTAYLCDRSGCADCRQTGILHDQKAAGTQSTKGKMLATKAFRALLTN